MSKHIADDVYPERRFGGFTRIDGTIAFYSRVQALLGPDNVVLDLGCGRGVHSEDSCEFRRRVCDLRGNGRHVIGIDVDCNAASNPYLNEFRIIHEVGRWPVDETSVDLVLSDNVLEHVEEPDIFFSEVRRILRRGGYLAIRTPNSWSYSAIAARFIPNRLHAKVLQLVQDNRKEKDVFPTVYRCNTSRRLRRTLAKHGFDSVTYAFEPEPAYMSFSRCAYRLAAIAHSVMPPMFRSTLLVFARKT